MMIFMSHPQHGQMHVYSESDAVANEKHGWVRDIPKQEIPAVEKPSEVNINTDFEDGHTLFERYENKFGKKPHHRMSQSTIEAKLKE
jgi:hypothetical protein